MHFDLSSLMDIVCRAFFKNNRFQLSLSISCIKLASTEFYQKSSCVRKWGIKKPKAEFGFQMDSKTSSSDFVAKIWEETYVPFIRAID